MLDIKERTVRKPISLFNRVLHAFIAGGDPIKPHDHRDAKVALNLLAQSNKDLSDAIDYKNEVAKRALWEEHRFTADGRLTLESLYEIYDQLEQEGWTKELVYTETITKHTGETVSYPVYAYSYKGEHPESIWILGGVHGEEPAGPNAFAHSINIIKDLKNKGVSSVFIPVLNPAGYDRDWRYFDVPRDRDAGFNSSVTDSEHVLYSKIPGHEHELMHHEPRNEFAGKVISWITNKSREFKPLVVFDHHEDLLERLGRVDDAFTYSYVYGDEHSPVIKNMCAEVSAALSANGAVSLAEGTTGFSHLNEKIENGIIMNSWDGSADQHFYDNLGAKAVFVLETTRTAEVEDQLPERIAAQENIMKLYYPFYQQLIEEQIPEPVAV